MSHYMTALAMKQAGLKPAAKIVLYWLADHHNESTGACFPSLNTLAKECEMNRSTLVRHLDDLESKGLIQRTHRVRENGSQTSTEYYLHLVPVAKCNTPCCEMQQPPVAKCDPHNLGNNNLGNEQETYVSSALFALDSEPADRFDEFWEQYPHRNGAKKGKDAARKSWSKALKSKASQSDIIGGAMKYANDRQVLDGYAKNPATWLNQKGWEDDIETSTGGYQRGQARSGSGMAQAFAAVAAREAAKQRGC